MLGTISVVEDAMTLKMFFRFCCSSDVRNRGYTNARLPARTELSRGIKRKMNQLVTKIPTSGTCFRIDSLFLINKKTH
jgi:hypothetical protein